MSDDPRRQLAALFADMRRRWPGAVLPDLDPMLLPDDSARALLAHTQHRVRVLLEGERSEWRPKRGAR